MGGGQRKLESASAALKSSFLFETGSFSLPDSLALSELFPQPRWGCCCRVSRQPSVHSLSASEPPLNAVHVKLL